MFVIRIVICVTTRPGVAARAEPAGAGLLEEQSLLPLAEQRERLDEGLVEGPLAGADGRRQRESELPQAAGPGGLPPVEAFHPQLRAAADLALRVEPLQRQGVRSSSA